MAKKRNKAQAEEGFWHEFEESLEHLRDRKAIIVVVLDRATGDVEVDDTMSTPAETWYALDCAAQVKSDALARTNTDPED